MMKTNKLAIGVLALLGFGAVLGSGCAHRGSKSRAPEVNPEPEIVSDTMQVRVMYGVQLAPFDPDKPIRDLAAPDGQN